MAINQGSKAGHESLIADINDRATHTELTNAITTHNSDASAHTALHNTITGETTAAVAVEAVNRDAAIAAHNGDTTAHSHIRGLVADVENELIAHNVDTTAHSDIRSSFGNFATHYEVTSAIADEINRAEGEYVHKVNPLGEFSIKAKRTGTTPGTADWTLRGDEYGRLFWGSIDITRDVAGMDLKSAQTVLSTGVKTFQSQIYNQDISLNRGDTTRGASTSHGLYWIDTSGNATAEIISNFKAGGGSEFIFRGYRDNAVDSSADIVINYPAVGTPYLTGPSITDGTQSKIVTEMDLGKQIFLINAIPDAVNPNQGSFDKTAAEIRAAIARGEKLLVKLKNSPEESMYFECTYIMDDGTDFVCLFDCAISGPEIEQLEWDGSINVYYFNVTSGENKFRYYTLPLATASNVGTILQYTGPTDATYTNGYYYKCVASPTSPPVYSWEQLDVQPRPAGVFEIIGTPDATDPDKGTFNKTAAEIRQAKTERKHIVLTIDGGGNEKDYLDLMAYIDDGTVLELSFGTTYSYPGTILTYQANWSSATNEYTFAQIDGEVRFRDTSLPAPGSEYEGQIWQYTGSTTSSYTKGHFYECVRTSYSPPVYSWQEVEVQKVSGIFEITGTADPGDPTQGTFNKTLAEIRAAKAQGSHFILKIAEAGEDIYYDLMSYYDDSSNFVMNFIQQVPDTKGKEVGISFDGSTLKYQVVEIFLEERFRYTYLPTATIYNEGKIVQYTGSTTTTAPIYKNGHFYKSVFLGAGVYAWQAVDVQDGGGIFVINATETSLTTGVFDKTTAEMIQAYNEGKHLIVKQLAGTNDYYYYNLLHYYESGGILEMEFVLSNPDTKGRELFMQYETSTSSYNLLTLYHEDRFRYDTMPAASSGNEGKIYQYTGGTTASYTQGRFYKCVSNGATPPVYSWQEVSFGDPKNVYEILSDKTAFADGKTAEVHAKMRAGQSIVMKYDGDLYYQTEYTEATVFVRGRTIRDGNPEETKWIMFAFRPDDSGIRECYSGVNYGIAQVYVPSASASDYYGRYVINTSGTIGDYVPGFLYKSDGTTFNDVLQNKVNTFTSMPTANAKWLGKHAQYMGATTTTAPIYKHGYFYECVSDGATPPVYSWEKIDFGGLTNTAQYSNSLTIDGNPTIKNYAINIGYQSAAGHDMTTALGAEAEANGSYSIAIGANAKVSGTNSIQIGSGNNIYGYTFQVKNYTLLNLSTGLIPYERLSDKFEEMPTPSSVYADGKIYQYIGPGTATAPIYRYGHFYRCIEDISTSPATYSWVEVNVNATPDGVTITKNISDQLTLQSGGLTDGVSSFHLKWLASIPMSYSAERKRLYTANNFGMWSSQDYIVDPTSLTGKSLTNIYTILANTVSGQVLIYPYCTFTASDSPTGSASSAFTLKLTNNTDYTIEATDLVTGYSYFCTCTAFGSWTSWKKLTRNVTYGTTAPSSPIEGDIWISPEGSPSDVYTKTEADAKFSPLNYETVTFTPLSTTTGGSVNAYKFGKIVIVDLVGVQSTSSSSGSTNLGSLSLGSATAQADSTWADLSGNSGIITVHYDGRIVLWHYTTPNTGIYGHIVFVTN